MWLLRMKFAKGVLDNVGFGQVSVPRFYGVLVGAKHVESDVFVFALKSIVMATNLSHLNQECLQ